MKASFSLARNLAGTNSTVFAVDDNEAGMDMSSEVEQKGSFCSKATAASTASFGLADSVDRLGLMGGFIDLGIGISGGSDR